MSRTFAAEVLFGNYYSSICAEFNGLEAKLSIMA
jgi:hypothetical protein